MATIDRSVSRGISGPAVTGLRSVLTGPRASYSRLIGALFLLGFLFYGVGFSLVTSVTDAHDFFSTIPAHKTTLTLGACLMLLNIVVEVGKGVLFYPILENHGKRTALFYLAVLIVEAVLLAIGALCLLMLVPLSERAADAGSASATWAPSLASLLTDANTIAYNVGQATLCFGGVFLCALLFRTRLIPRPLAALGVIGYAVHAVGAVSEVFGIPIGTFLLIPGGLFEVVVAFWLIIKGLQSATDGNRADEAMNPTTHSVPVAN